MTEFRRVPIDTDTGNIKLERLGPNNCFTFTIDAENDEAIIKQLNTPVYRVVIHDDGFNEEYIVTDVANNREMCYTD